jgi:WD40 repeat protein
MNKRKALLRTPAAVVGIGVASAIGWLLAAGCAPPTNTILGEETGSATKGASPAPTLMGGLQTLKTKPVPEGREALSAANLERMTELGHFGEGWPAAVDFSPDGSRLALGTSRGVEILSAADGGPLAVYPFSSPVLAVLFSPDGKRLAVGQQDGTVLVLDAASGQTLQRLLWHSRPVHGLAFSGWMSTGEPSVYLASGAEDGSIAVWDLGSGQIQYHFINPLLGYWGYGIRSLAFSPDDSILVTGGDQGYLSRWDLSTGEELPRWQTQYGLLFSVAFSPDGSRLASACGDGTVQIWDFASGKPLVLLQGHAYGAWSAAWSRDGKRFATGAGDGTVKLWDPESGTLIREKEATFTKIDSLQYSPDGSRLAAVSIGERAFLLDSKSLAETQSFPGFLGGLRSTAFSPDGQWAALSGENGVTYLWSLLQGEVTGIGNVRPASKTDISAEFSPDGKLVAIADGLPGIVRLIERNSLGVRSEKRVMGIRAIAFSPDGRFLAAGGSSQLLLFGTETGTTQTADVPSRIVSLAFADTTENPVLAGGLEDGSILLWDPENLSTSEIFSKPGNSVVWSLSSAGPLLAAGDDRGDIRVWDMAQGKILQTFSGYMGAVFGLAISPDGSLLAAGGITGSLRFWSLRNGSLLRVVSAHNGWVNGLAFSPDGRWMLSAGSDGVGQIWGIPA